MFNCTVPEGSYKFYTFPNRFQFISLKKSKIKSFWFLTLGTPLSVRYWLARYCTILLTGVVSKFACLYISFKKKKKKPLLSYYSVCTLFEENFSIQAFLKSLPNWKSYEPTTKRIKLCSSISTFLSHSSLYPQRPIKSNCPFARIIRLINSHNFNHWSSLFANVVGLLLFFEVHSLFFKIMFFLCSLNLCCLLRFIFFPSFLLSFIFIFYFFTFWTFLPNPSRVNFL